MYRKFDTASIVFSSTKPAMRIKLFVGIRP